MKAPQRRGSCRRALRPLASGSPILGVFEFAITDRGTIVASLIVRDAGPSDPLVVEVDQTGRVVRRFDVRRAMAGRDDHRNGRLT